MNDIKITYSFVAGEYLVERRRSGAALGRVLKDRDDRWFAMQPGSRMLVSSEEPDRKFRKRSEAVEALVAYADLTSVV